jgi:hypothetical protein
MAHNHFWGLMYNKHMYCLTQYSSKKIFSHHHWAEVKITSFHDIMKLKYKFSKTIFTSPLGRSENNIIK